MAYYPTTNIIMQDTTIQRNRVLPANALGDVAQGVGVGTSVNPNKVVALGEIPEAIRIYDIAKHYGIKPDNEEKLAEKIAVEIGQELAEGDYLVNFKGRRQRRKAPTVPGNGRVLHIEKGQIIVEIEPVPVRIQARMPATVVDIIAGRGVRLETQGVVLQCAWGNGQFSYSAFAMEPETGLESLVGRDLRLEGIRGRVYILPRPLTAKDIEVAIQLGIDGLVGSTMPHYLIDIATSVRFPILLTDGFGKRRTSDPVFSILKKRAGQAPAAFDAYEPNRWEGNRAEIIIPKSGSVEMPSPPKLDVPARIGAKVRLQRAPYDGVFAEIIEIPESAQPIDNSLRTSVARVKLDNGNIVNVPVNNIELLGS